MSFAVRAGLVGTAFRWPERWVRWAVSASVTRLNAVVGSRFRACAVVTPPYRVTIVTNVICDDQCEFAALLPSECETPMNAEKSDKYRYIAISGRYFSVIRNTLRFELNDQVSACINAGPGVAQRVSSPSVHF
ncbi:hypothetical protein ACIRRA_33640 [Nocardia sp. NPDC101769]|uniref:hypothetical protein n=1 Tax=Nocardia sp. NPDC101769 TaxID=3364333 RepID=UPI00382C81AD